MLLTGLPDQCAGCPLSTNKSCGHFTRITGKGTTGVLIVGEASGEHEAEQARPFIEWAASGAILEKAIRTAGGTRDDFWLTNVVRCRPPNNVLLGAEYERAAIDHCSSYLNRAIDEYAPRAILALGGIPLRELTNFHGGKRGISYVRGYPLPGPKGIPVIPSFHPAFITRGNTHLIPLLMKDLASARSAAAGRLTYVLNPADHMDALEGVEAFEHLYREALANPDLWIAYDIETKESQEGVEDELVEFEGGVQFGIVGGEYEYDDGEVGERSQLEYSGESSGDVMVGSLDTRQAEILSIQFAISDTWGVFGDWHDERIREIAQRILDLPNPKVAHNGNHFDKPILERHGVRIKGRHFDSLSLRKSLQPDLPAGLQQVAVDYGWLFPWKHYSGSDAVLYGVADVCSLIRIIYKLPHELARLGMWDGYEKYIYRHREMVEIPWERRGIPMSVPRLDEFRDWLTEEVGQKIEGMMVHVPPEMHKKGPTEAGFSNLPEEIKPFVYERHPEVITPKPRFRKDGSPLLDEEGNQVYYKKEPYTVTQIYNMLLDGTLEGTLELVLEKFPDLRVMSEGHKLYRHIPFNPRSSQQMINYIKFMKERHPLVGYEVPLSFKEGKETTADKLMKRLEVKTKDPVIAYAREIRAYEKMRDSYTGKLGDDGVARGGWIPDADGRLRTRAMTNSTWQFSSVSPNVFTLPKRREELAKRFRKTVAAEPGHVMIEFDFKAFHDLTTAALATDDRKWRTAKLDPHAYVAGWLVHYPGIETALSLSDADLKLYLREIRDKHEKVRNEQAKPLNHGTNFGQGYRRLYAENEEFFKDENQAKQMLEMLKRVYPKTFAWQERLLESLDIKAGRTPYLQSVWGARRWFWDVWAWKKDRYGRWYKAKGQDAEKALAFLPANNAHGMFRLKMLEMAELELLDRYELINFPHDALVFHPPIELAQQCIEDVKTWMEAPVMELANEILCPNGFSCGVDVHMGPDLGTLTEIKC